MSRVNSQDPVRALTQLLTSQNRIPRAGGDSVEVLVTKALVNIQDSLNAGTPGSGTVTSVDGSGGSTGLSLSGGPVTGSGTLTLGGTLAVASGGTGTSSPALVAGTNVTITGSWPNQTINSTGGVSAQVVPLATFIFDGAGSAPAAATSTNSKPVPSACTIIGYTITSDVSGSCIVDVKKATGGGSFSSITASAKPTLSNASYLDSSTLTGWTTSISAHDCVKASVTSASTLTAITLVIYGTLN